LGTPTLEIVSNRLVVSTFDYSGAEGVSIHLGGARGWRGQFDPVDLLSANMGLQFTAKGMLGGALDQVLATSSIEGNNGKEYVMADFSPIGAQSAVVIVRGEGGELLQSYEIANAQRVDITSIFPALCTNGEVVTTFLGSDGAWYKAHRVGCNCIGTNCWIER